MWGDIAIAFLLAFIVTFMTVPYTMKIAKKIGAVDIPKDQRRMHKKVMPRFGGPAVILGFLVAVIYLLIVMSMENKINLFGEEQYGMKLIRNAFGDYCNFNFLCC
jgi:UDP-N-acetylmuramyl pentapeptide phosphotransferase/UDP-N-acetylglucosamine-1-phosphate transferase